MNCAKALRAREKTNEAREEFTRAIEFNRDLPETEKMLQIVEVNLSKRGPE